jgi:hypothetical protein
MKIPENTGRKQDGKFLRGQSGNPAGKPPGTLHKATQAMQTMLEGETEALTRKAVELALEGDITALKLCLDRIAPAYKPSARPVTLDMPPPDNLTDTARAFVSAAARGEIPPDIAAQLVSAVASVARVEEMEQVKERLAALERAIREQKK